MTTVSGNFVDGVEVTCKLGGVVTIKMQATSSFVPEPFIQISAKYSSRDIAVTVTAEDALNIARLILQARAIMIDEQEELSSSQDAARELTAAP